MRRLLILFPFAILGALLFSGPAYAGDTPVIDLRVEIELQASGYVNVNQSLSYSAETPLNWKIFSHARDVSVVADTKELGRADWKLSSKNGANELTTTESSSQWTVRYSVSSNLIRQQDRDQFFLKIVENPGVPIYSSEILFLLPPGVTSESLSGNLYAIGGVSGATFTKIDGGKLRYQTEFAGPQALLTINASWPESVLKLSLFQELRLGWLNLDFLPWIILGLALPLASLILLARLFIKQRRDETTPPSLPTTDSPPSALSPVIVGVLIHKKIYPEVIASLLVDFCVRGYAVIVRKGGEYYLGRRKAADSRLEDWESHIFDELFPTLQLTTSSDDLRQLNKQTLFSPRIRAAFSQIYQVITEKQFFAENPHVTRVRYKLLALGFYFAALIGLAWVAVTDASPYLTVPLVGTLIASWLIIKLTPKLIRYTDSGKQARLAWLSFAGYLGTKNRSGIETARNQTFEKYLPYAVALHSTEPWAERFAHSSTALIQPDWLITYQDTAPEQLTQEITKFTKAISKKIATLRGPLVN